MSRLLITTVGTSLLTNRDRPWSPAERPWRPGAPLPEAELVDGWLAEADPVLATAETNTLRGVGVADTDRVHLLHSDTPDGRFCSARLRHFYEHTIGCRAVEERQIAALGFAPASFAQRGLRNLVSLAMASIRDAKQLGLEPIFCATAGFKAELAFLNLLGALVNVEVFYRHEQFREIVRLPRLPLTWDADCVVQHREFFDWIDAEPRRSDEVESWLRGSPELRPLVEDSGDGHTYLNAAGNLLFEAAKQRLSDRPRARWPDDDARPPDQKDKVSGAEHHRPSGWHEFVRKLCKIDCVTLVRYDAAALGGPPVKMLNAAEGTLAVRFGPPDNPLPLLVDTTARGEAQTTLVLNFVRQLV
jgi:putative CRISPR-associated protein (TIGR02619 family)